MANTAEENKPTLCERLGTECTNFRKFLFNPETKQVLGRSGKSWAKIGLFYLIFYGFLAGFFSAMLAVFLTTVKKPGDGPPKLTQFIKNQAGLTVKTSLSMLNNFDSTNEKSAEKFTEEAKKFLEYYNDTDIYSGGTCNTNNKDGISSDEEPCHIDFNLYESCSPSSNTTTSFGFKEKTPCVFVRINKVYGWVPSNGGSNFLKLDCVCSQALTKEGCVKNVFPEGFLLAGFPFRGKKGHELPLVAVQIDATKTGKDGRVECKLVGDDIKVSESFKKTKSFGNIRIEEVYARD